jgi:hypothetical protein
LLNSTVETYARSITLIRRLHVRVGLLTLLMALAACNLPSQTATPTPLIPTIPALTSEPTSEAATTEPSRPAPTADAAAFEQTLREALIAEDFATIETLMGEAFLMQYSGGEGGLIAISDSISLLRDSLLSGPDPIAFDETVAPGSLIDGQATPGLILNHSLFSRGWGASGTDHAGVLIALDELGNPYFGGLIYARGGFAEAQSTSEPTGEAQPTAEAGAPTPQPARRGDSIYESDFRIGWALFDEDRVTSQRSEDGYQLNVLGNWAGWSYSTQIDESEFYAEITAEPLECPDRQGSYGLMFHYVDTTHFRLFIVWCDGQFSLVERTESNRAAVLHEAELPEGIDPAAGEHRLGVLAQGNTLAMYMDDIRVGAVTVGSMPEGDMGPYAETIGAQSISVLFSRLAVFEPGR